MNALNRRRFLAAGAALGGALALGPLTGCATPRRSAPHVVVVGAGFGGATLARYLRLWGGEAIRVTLIEREPRFISCPLSNLVVAGALSLEELSAGHDSLARRHGIQVIHDEVLGFDPERRSLRLRGADTPLGYDRLVLSPGIDFTPDDIPGLGAALDAGQALHAWKAGPQTLALRERLQALPEGGVVLMSIPKAPYRCPPGPYERASLIADYLQRHKPRAKLLVFDANPQITSKKALFEQVFARHPGRLEYRPDSELQELDGARGEARFAFDQVRADLLNPIPPQRAARLVMDSPLEKVNGRWAKVDWRRMASTSHADIHLLGDALFAAPAMPKSGHMANQHAKYLAAVLLHELAGAPALAEPLLTNTCYSFVTPEEAIHVASVHRYDAAQNTFVTVDGSGGVSTGPNPAEARFAHAWARNIRADLLG